MIFKRFLLSVINSPNSGDDIMRWCCSGASRRTPYTTPCPSPSSPHRRRPPAARASRFNYLPRWRRQPDPDPPPPPPPLSGGRRHLCCCSIPAKGQLQSICCCSGSFSHRLLVFVCKLPIISRFNVNTVCGLYLMVG